MCIAAFYNPPLEILKVSKYKIVGPIEFFTSWPFLVGFSLLVGGFVYVLKHGFSKFTTIS